MSDPLYTPLPMLTGIQIIPDDAIPRGYKRTEGNSIRINPVNYDYIRPLGAKGTMIVLGLLGEVANE